MIINPSKISPQSFVGRVLRMPLRAIPRTAILPIMQGPARGMRWVVGSSNHSCWLGTHEPDKQLMMAELIGPGQVYYDIGANAGFYTLMASKLVGPQGKVYAFEPLPENLSSLRKHIALNHSTNIELFDCALSDENGESRFALHDSNSMGKLSDSGELVVRTERLDDVAAREQLRAPDCLKLDVEGAELGVLLGARGLIEEHRPIILLATHGPEVHKECVALLRDLGYDLRSLSDKSIEQTDELLATHSTRP